MQPKPSTSLQDFLEGVVPPLAKRWLKRCFCRNPGFLKLISFDFANYGKIAPVELLDSELIWSEIIAKHFQPLGEWTVAGGEAQRIFRCPQCETELFTRSEQYSINMWPTISRPTDNRSPAAIGLYLVGFHFFAGKFDPDWIDDFKPARNVDEFISSVTTAAQAV